MSWSVIQGSIVYIGLDDTYVMPDLPFSLGHLKAVEDENLSFCAQCGKKYNIRRRATRCQRCKCTYCLACCSSTVYLSGNNMLKSCCLYCYVSVTGLGLSRDLLHSLLDKKVLETYTVSTRTLLVLHVFIRALLYKTYRDLLRDTEYYTEAFYFLLQRFWGLREQCPHRALLYECLSLLIAILAATTSPTQLELLEIEKRHLETVAHIGESTFNRRIRRVVKKNIISTTLAIFGTKRVVDPPDANMCAFLLLLRNTIIGSALFQKDLIKDDLPITYILALLAGPLSQRTSKDASRVAFTCPYIVSARDFALLDNLSPEAHKSLDAISLDSLTHLYKNPELVDKTIDVYRDRAATDAACILTYVMENIDNDSGHIAAASNIIQELALDMMETHEDYNICLRLLLCAYRIAKLANETDKFLSRMETQLVQCFYDGFILEAVLFVLLELCEADKKLLVRLCGKPFFADVLEEYSHHVDTFVSGPAERIRAMVCECVE